MAYKLPIQTEWLGPTPSVAPSRVTVPVGVPGATGADGADGPAGPNSVSGTTTTTLTGILRGNSSVVGTVTVGSGLTFDGTTLTASGAVSSVFGRTGVVVAATGDYDVSQVTNAARLNAANTFTVGGQVIQGDLTVYGGTFAGSTATEPGVTFKFTDNAGTGRIGLRGSSWNTLAFWASGQTTSDVPILQINNSSGVTLGGNLTHSSGSIRFACRNDLGTTPGVLIDSFAAGMPAVRILAPASNTGESIQLWGTSSTATSRAQSAITSTWADATDATRSGRLTLGVYSTTTLQEGIRITADPTTGHPFVSLWNVSAVEMVRLSCGGSVGTAPYVAVAQVAGVGSGSVRLEFSSPRLGLSRWSSVYVGHFCFYDTSVGTSVLDCVFSGASTDLRYLGTTRVRVNSTGIGFFGVTPVARAALAADATDSATAITLVNDLKTKLVALGLCS